MGTDIEKLTEGNYEDWAPVMEALLVDKDVWGVVSGDDVEPLGGPNSKPVKTFRRKKDIAKAKIVLSVHKTQLPHTRFETPKEIWDELARIHTLRSFGSLLAMRRRFFTMAKAPNQSIQSWAADVRHSAYLLEKADFEVTEIDKVLALTQGLPESYTSLIVLLDSIPPDELTFEGVIGRLLNEETRQTHSTVVKTEPKAEPEDTAMAVVPAGRRFAGEVKKKGSGLQGVHCHKCRGIGHMRNACPSLEDDVANAVDEEPNTAACANEVDSLSDSDLW